MNSAKISVSAIAIASSIVFSVAATAQDQKAQGQNAAAPETSGAGFDEIIVTARRTAERLQDVPISITAFNQETLSEKGVRDVFDLQQATPGLIVSTTNAQGRSGGTYNIRGQRQSADDAPPGVVTYLNDVPIFGPSIARSFFDLESLQVLKGPQGTLFGRNTNGGAVLINTQKPTDAFEGYVKARYGNLSNKYLEAAVNFPIAEGIALRVAGNLERRDGFTKNLTGPDLDDLSYQNFRASLRIAPEGSGFENLLVVNAGSSDESGVGLIVTEFFPGAPLAGLLPGGVLGPNRLGALTNAIALGPRTVSIARPGFNRGRHYGVSNTTTVDLNDNLVLKNIMGYQQLKFDGQLEYTNSDFLGAPVNFLAVDYSRNDKQMSEELQLQGNFLDGRLNTIIGGFYSFNQQDPLGPDDSRTPTGLTSRGYVYSPELLNSFNENYIRQTSKALFGQVDFKVTDKLSLTAGYRYTWDDQKASGRYTQTFGGSPRFCTIPPVIPDPDPRFTVNLPNCYLTAKTAFSAGNYAVSANYKAGDDTLLYVTHRHGFKTGGVTTTGPFYGRGAAFSPEFVDDVEAGIKTSGFLGDMRYQFNAAGYHSWFDGLQVTQLFVLEISPGRFLTPNLIQNVAKARVYGVDLELTLEPVKGLTLSGTFNYFKGTFDEGAIRLDSAGGALTDVSGFDYASQPEIMYTLGSTYETELGDETTLKASAFYSYTKGYFNTYDATPANFIDGYGVLSARFGLENIGGSNIGVVAYGRNLTNELYVNGISPGRAFGYISTAYGEPRTYGVELSYKF